MKNDRKVRETLAKIGTLAGVGEDWYEIGEAEYDDVADDNVRYGVYAKSDEIADKVGKVLDKLMADRKTEPLDKDINVRSKAIYDKWGNVFDARADIEDEPKTSGYPYEIETSSVCKTEPQRGCDADCHEDCTECAKEWQDWKDQMWTEAVIEAQTESE